VLGLILKESLLSFSLWLVTLSFRCQEIPVRFISVFSVVSDTEVV
jgi:hypothetical protein